MKVLVVTASRHHATDEIGDVLVEELRAAGHEARRAAPEEVATLDGVDAVVLGSAVYMTQWMPSAREFARRFESELAARPLYAFSVGLAGVAGGDAAAPQGAAGLVRRLAPRGHVTFRGRLSADILGLRERTVVVAGSAPEGDFREWDKVHAYGREIAAGLREPAVR